MKSEKEWNLIEAAKRGGNDGWEAWLELIKFWAEKKSEILK